MRFSSRTDENLVTQCGTAACVNKSLCCKIILSGCQVLSNLFVVLSGSLSIAWFHVDLFAFLIKLLGMKYVMGLSLKNNEGNFNVTLSFVLDGSVMEIVVAHFI